MRMLYRVMAAALIVSLVSTSASAQSVNKDSSPEGVTDAINKINELQAALSNLDASAFKKTAGAPKKAEDLAKTLYAFSSGLDTSWDKTKAAAIVSTASVLSAAINNPAEPTKTILQQDDNSNETLNALLIAIQKLGLRDPGLVIRVNEAKFGDTYTKAVSVKRWCDATSYMRALCDRHGTCSLDQDYQDKACGFNPAPAADLGDRGLYVDYQCVLNREGSFAGTYQQVGAKPTSPVLNKSRDHYVVLRGGGALVCGGGK